jgi:hypothetical protein
MSKFSGLHLISLKVTGTVVLQSVSRQVFVDPFLDGSGLPVLINGSLLLWIPDFY